MKPRSTIGVLFVVLLAPSLSTAQESEVPSVLSVFRSQAGEIASDVLRATSDAVPVSVALVVEDAPQQRVVENGFLEVLSGRGVAVHDAGAAADASNILRVLILEQSAAFDSLGVDEYRRTVRTALEARLEAGQGAPIRYLGTFERTSVDTLRSPEPVEWIQGGSAPDAEESTFSRIVAPLVIIGGAALIVYLFFAVRSS